MLVCSAWEEVDIIFDKNAQRAQNYFFITGTKGQMSSCTINFNRPMSAADWGQFFALFSIQSDGLQIAIIQIVKISHCFTTRTI